MSPFLMQNTSNYIVVALMLASMGSACVKGRGPAWTHVPLAAFVIASVGPSVFATTIWLAYGLGLMHPGPSGYRLSTLVRDLPVDFAMINWGFAALYLACRLSQKVGAARSAMWASVVAMSVPNIALFSLAWEMVSNVFDAGQGIGIVMAMISFPIIDLDIGFGIGSIIGALTAPLPLLGLAAWLAARFVGWLVRE